VDDHHAKPPRFPLHERSVEDGRVRRPRYVHYAYLLRCADGSYYAGYTTDPRRRESEHDAGEGAKYTRGRTPVELVHVEAFDSQSAAMSREYTLKQLSHDEKRRLAAETDVERVLGEDPHA
jgi:putative endonuclease